MTLTVGTALLTSGILLFWCARVGTRLAQPPRWTSDTMIMCFIAPAVLFLLASGAGIVIYASAQGGWRDMTSAGATELGGVLAAGIALGALVARWSRRAPRKAAAEVVAMPLPQTPEPPQPAPQLGAARKAA